MKTVTIIEDFTGYPDDTEASRRDFVAGEVVDLDDAFADLIVSKGHATEGGVKADRSGSENQEPA